ncbi:hypothetical protein [Sphingomicrobium astaxanthinifaciens]|uniref:hypothetical protein n=1 Tax=Sphingomicrobium astaxanthinifaciens TaxID=1227949 RepID=UPI001FCBE58D|nr:hypothetical protein [Sphingomicrobium astaxanthinifaciens]MCJ7422075.1 hypothetical protein [Sphingomicrobium astaxanthinifaciens]
MVRKLLLASSTLLLAACAGEGRIENGGIVVARSLCPQVGIPAGTGSVTLFDPADSTRAEAIDVTAAITNLDGQCAEDQQFVTSSVSFDVQAARRVPGPARTLTLPIFNVAVQGGDTVVAKRVGSVRLDFAEGALRTETRGQASIRVARAAATLPDAVRAELTRKRRAGDVDAAIDPLSRPEIRSAVARASFEQLVGFQLTPEQLRYNATK